MDASRGLKGRIKTGSGDGGDMESAGYREGGKAGRCRRGNMAQSMGNHRGYSLTNASITTKEVPNHPCLR
jgi:hypothetical protein